MTPDAMTAGLWLYTALALLVLAKTRRVGLVVAALAAVWVPWLLAKDPATARTAIILVGGWFVARYGWRWLTLLGGLGLLYALLLWQRVTEQGWDFGAAALDAFNRAVYAAAFVAAGWWFLQLVTGRGRYVVNPLAIAAERRKRQATAEHRRAMGWGRRGLGRLGQGTRKAVTGRQPPRPPDNLDTMGRTDLSVLARRAGIKPAQHTTDELRDLVREAQARPPEPATARPHPPGPPPATADDAPQPQPVLVEMHGTAGGHIPEPFAQPAPWRWRR